MTSVEAIETAAYRIQAIVEAIALIG